MKVSSIPQLIRRDPIPAPLPPRPERREWCWRQWTITATADAPLWLITICPPGTRLGYQVGTAMSAAEAERNGRVAVDRRIGHVCRSLGLTDAMRRETLDLLADAGLRAVMR